MENSEIQQSSVLEKKEMILDTKSLAYLTEIRKWAKFLAILGFIFLGLLVLLGFIFLSVGSFFGSFLGGIERILIFFVYLAIGALYFFPIYYLLRFSIDIKKAIEKTEQRDITTAFEYLKSHYKFIGILTIVVLCLYFFIGIIALIVGLYTAF